MFSHLVMLKKAPWFLYCESEAIALKTCESFPNEVSGIVVAESLMVKQPRLVNTLEQAETFQIEAPKEGEPVSADLPLDVQIDAEEILKEIQDEIIKELES